MKKTLVIFHWIIFTYFVYLFGYASLFKVLRKRSMLEGMESLGFNETWTLLIGAGELLGVFGLLVGIIYHKVKNLATLWLLFFAVGALAVHFAHKDYTDYYDALFGSLAAFLLLISDRHFKLEL